MANAVKEIEHAVWLLEHNDVSLGEYEKLIKPWEDAEPIVRCKDCKYYKQQDDTCPYVDENGYYREFPSEDDYCSRGERMDEVEEMKVVDRKPVPIYEVECYECHSKIEYKASEVSFTGYISCPVCGSRVYSSTSCPVRMDEVEE